MLEDYVMETGEKDSGLNRGCPPGIPGRSVRMYLSGRTRTTLNSLPEKGVSGTGGH